MTWERRSPDDEDLYRLSKVGLTVREIAAKHSISKSVVAARIARYKKNVLGPRAEADAALAAERRAQRDREAAAQRRVERLLREQAEDGATPTPPAPYRPPQREELLHGRAGYAQWLSMRDLEAGRISQTDYDELAASGFRPRRARRTYGSTMPLDPVGRRNDD